MTDVAFIDLPDNHVPPLKVAILVCPAYAPADIIGIHTVLGIMPGATVELVWKNLDEVIGIPKYPTRPTMTFDDCPTDLDVLWVGAVGDPAIFEDTETLEFLADRGERARWVGGNCAGSLLVGAAGLLQGYRATTNFQQKHLLPYFGAIPADGNVVIDRNRITAGPLTGSIEAALMIVQDIYGDDVAREMELQCEYETKPLFGVGSPELAGPELTQQALDHGAAMGKPFEDAAERAARRLGVTVTA